MPLNYRADLVCFESVVVEVKALKAVGPIEQAQAINYLKASRLARGLILNFGARSLEYRRVVLSRGRCDVTATPSAGTASCADPPGAGRSRPS